MRDFGEIPTDHEFENGELTLVMDDCNPGTSCMCLPGYFKRLTVTAKVRMQDISVLLLVINFLDSMCIMADATPSCHTALQYPLQPLQKSTLCVLCMIVGKN